MIFVTGIVPESFGVGLVHPILKKGKPADQCASYRPITVLTTFCKLFESLTFDEIALRCTTPDDQLEFQKALRTGTRSQRSCKSSYWLNEPES